MDHLLSLYPRFAFPEALILLVLVPASIYLGARLRALASFRKWAAITLRALIVTLLVFALAGAEIVKKRDKLAVFFLLDHSNSVPENLQTASAQWVRDASSKFMTRKDEAGVIVFGAEPSLELAVGPGLKLDQIRSFVNGEQTDLAAAIRLAQAAFPQGYMHRIVLYTDGNETRGSALEEAKLAQAAGIELDVVPLPIGGGREVRLAELSAPAQAKADEPFQLRVVVHADQDCEGSLKVYQRLREGKRLIVAQEVKLRAGDNVFLLTQTLHAAGFYEYEAVIESDADTVLANNEGRAFTVVSGEPTVLYVEADPTHSRLQSALTAEGLKVEAIAPAAMPAGLPELQNYDAIVLSNVSATELGAETMQNLETAVRDLGIGLVMIGGPDSFGAGGYLDTPVERALPVDMSVKEHKILPRGALVLVMHTCEIQEGNLWAREIGLASLNVLASQDLMAAIGYMWSGPSGFSGDSWIYPLQPVGDKTMMRSMLTKAASQIGDMPSVDPSLKMAYDALVNADAAVKRVVLISDGDPAPPSTGLIKNLKTANIAVSTVCIAPHSPNDQNMLSNIAKATGGQYYFVANPRNLPQIFSKEAAVVKRGMFFEEPFTPKVKHDSELLLGFMDAGFPQLRGYVVTTAKPNATVPLVSAHEDDPVLAHWRYGLGKSIAFTSDVTTRWAPDWIGWAGFDRFWAQAVRWSMREMKSSNFRVETKARGDHGHVRLDAVDEAGKFVNFLSPRAVITGPGPDYKRTELDFLQTGPGIYEADFPLADAGAYMVNVTYLEPDGAAKMIPTGLALGYSREYEDNTANLPRLEAVASAAGGKVLNERDNPFVHNLKATATVTPIWPILAIIAACLFPVEIFIRRLAINYSFLWAPFVALARRLPLLGKKIPASSARPAPVTGYYGSAPGAAQAPTPADSPAASASFGVAPEAPPPEAMVAAAKKMARKQKRDEQAAEYTGQLLAAKKRAQEKTKPRSRSDADKEDK